MKQLYLTFLFLLLLTGIYISQYFFDQSKKRDPFTQPFIPKADVIKATDLGLDNAAADIVWLESIQYFGGTPQTDITQMPEYLNLTTSLDPKFSYPYAFGALVLPNIGQVDQGIALAQKGIQKAEPDWRIPYYLATTYHINKSDAKNAAYYFDIAVRTPGAPENIQKIAATYASNPDTRAQTESIWEGIYETTNDEVVKERAKNYITHYEILTLLENAGAEYKKINGKYPDSVDYLVPTILKSIPADPFGFQYRFDETGRAVIK